MARPLVAVVALVATVVAGLALLEGVASLVITAGLLFGSSGHLAQERYARYDPELGWVSRPNVAIPDMYGPGADLHTTARGFRGRLDPSPTIAPGKLRLVCSGDSFTFGYGVGDDAAWCALLAKLDPRLESVNMGQGGYGVDQAFLWYRRDGAALTPAIHLFAFIDGDFERMRSPRFLDYGKPTLALREGALIVEHVPAWRRPFWIPTVRLQEVVKRTKAYELVERLRRRSRGAATASSPVDPAERRTVADVAVAVFDALRTIAEQHDGVSILVYLPTLADCRLPVNAPTGLDWWKTIASRLDRETLRVIDLSASCRGLPAAEQDGLFIPEGAVPYYGAVGHYSVKGNLWVANALLQRLRPVVADLIAQRH
jgi:hypothetical protein